MRSDFSNCTILSVANSGVERGWRPAQEDHIRKAAIIERDKILAVSARRTQTPIFTT